MTPARSTLDAQGILQRVFDGGAGALRVLLGASISDDPPSDPADGDFWYEGDTGSLFIRVSGVWVQIPTGDLSGYAPVANPTFTGNVVVPDADADAEALNRQTGDGRYVALTGAQTVDGTKTFSSSPVTPGAGVNSTRLGTSAVAGGVSSTAIGATASAAGANGTALGFAASASAGQTVAVGRSATASATGAASFGYAAAASGVNSLAVGGSAASAGGSSVALGVAASVALSQTGGVAVGFQAVIASGTYQSPAVAVGYQATALEGRGTALGGQARAEGISSTAVGRGAIAKGSHGIAIGRGAWTPGTGAMEIAIGFSGGGGQTDVYFESGHTHKYEDPIDTTTITRNPSATPIVIHGFDAYDATASPTNNVAGGDLVLAAGRGTGTAAGGSVKLQAAPAGGVSNNTKNALVTRVEANATGLGFFGATPVAKPTGVAVDATGIHAALVDLGLIAA